MDSMRAIHQAAHPATTTATIPNKVRPAPAQRGRSMHYAWNPFQRRPASGIYIRKCRASPARGTAASLPDGVTQFEHLCIDSLKVRSKFRGDAVFWVVRDKREQSQEYLGRHATRQHSYHENIYSEPFEVVWNDSWSRRIHPA